jgi:integrase
LAKVRTRLVGKGNRRRKVYVVDHYDQSGTRQRPYFDTKTEADAFLGEVLRLNPRRGHRAGINPRLTFESYAREVLESIRFARKPRTLALYRHRLESKVLPVIGRIKLISVSREHIKTLCLGQLKTGYAPATVRGVLEVISAVLTMATDEGKVPFNVALGIGRQIGIGQHKAQGGEHDSEGTATSKALSLEDLAGFEQSFGSLRRGTTRLRAEAGFGLMAKAGLRVGEVCGLRWSDLDWEGKRVHVQRQAHRCKVDVDQYGKEARPKGGRKRWVVDLSNELLAALRRQEHLVKKLSLKRGWGACSPWMFPTEGNNPIDDAEWRRLFGLVRAHAGLGKHFSLHSLRHSYAVTTLNEVPDLQYVQRQLGHAGISITADLYGAGRKPSNPGVADRIATRVKALRRPSTGHKPGTRVASNQA